MQNKRGFWIIIIGMLIAVTVVWVGYSVYAAQTYTDINTSAYSYTSTINSEFDTETLDKIEEGINALPVPVEIYHDLKDQALIEETEALQDLSTTTE